MGIPNSSDAWYNSLTEDKTVYYTFVYLLSGTESLFHMGLESSLEINNFDTLDSNTKFTQ